MTSMGLNEIPDIILTSYNTENQLCSKIRVTKPVYDDVKIFLCILLSLAFIWKYNIFYRTVQTLKYQYFLLKITIPYTKRIVIVKILPHTQHIL